jgi:hypothetical protein
MRDDRSKEQPGQARRTAAQRALWLLVAATAVLFVCSAGIGVFAYITNNNRISDIQQSRITSCERTYEAFNQVFRPFFPPPQHRTAKQQHDLAKLHRTIRRLERHCTDQTSTRRTR